MRGLKKKEPRKARRTFRARENNENGKPKELKVSTFNPDGKSHGRLKFSLEVGGKDRKGLKPSSLGNFQKGLRRPLQQNSWPRAALGRLPAMGLMAVGPSRAPSFPPLFLSVETTWQFTLEESILGLFLCFARQDRQRWLAGAGGQNVLQRAHLDFRQPSRMSVGVKVAEEPSAPGSCPSPGIPQLLSRGIRRDFTAFMASPNRCVYVNIVKKSNGGWGCMESIGQCLLQELGATDKTNVRAPRQVMIPPSSSTFSHWW
ncbi:hypothetical protein RUM44_000108 [Polyplax serrata]|uniref:Uncharacterized protein n=1 Tax=Polyplax serrata TaxID=468196 RepID=A0ABR1B4J9_POLSC